MGIYTAGVRDRKERENNIYDKFDKNGRGINKEECKVGVETEI